MMTMLASRAIVEELAIIDNSVFVVVILDRGLDCFLGKDGAVDLLRGKTVEGFRNRLVGELERLADRLALDHFGCHRARCDRGAAAEGLELDVNDDVILDLEIYLHNISALCVADLADAVSILDDADVAGVAEMIHYLFAV